jgi:hypothetical protein
MTKFILGLIVGLYISEYYDYTFTALLNWVETLIDTPH